MNQIDVSKTGPHQLLIIAEGMDNTGKSTLVQKLGRHLGIEPDLSSGRMRTTEELFSQAWGRMNRPGTSIYDRMSIISDRVYGPIVRNYDPYREESEGRHLVQALKETPHLIIYCRPPTHLIMDFGGREQMKGVTENATPLLRAYDALIRKMINEGGWNIAVYDYTDRHSYLEILQRIGGMLGHDN